MVKHLYPDFLTDLDQYRLAEEYWSAVWAGINAEDRERGGWQTPWLSTGSPDLRDGNPIFSAWSPLLRRGIRVIQHGPTEPTLELQTWHDTFGGSKDDPESVHELVIACALSEESGGEALVLLRDWVEGQPSDTNGASPARDVTASPAG